ncbi:hypothetical protein LF824_02510 [Citrobacter freundii]|uniref:ABC-three component system protein n=1 Tax=Citrobacter freundii TaxID=546 RepID=UPI0019017496|nr:hypothetical protein [Citrobacter freundii]MBJ9155891.1 hypothetical protein [Citrobacter freundii]MCO5618580.1 hypothetical protein [Citrobacter freundii]MCO5627975.1 hypothetical protein [Citrobacter freundii]MCO5633667.1 hypothetical protein [Citrobacter freundii]MCO5637370.1 hypothetical protein [Citrobacter freundii]
MNSIQQRGGLGSTNIQNNFLTPSIDIVRSPSIFMNLVEIIASMDNFQDSSLQDDYSAYDIEGKIDFNDVIKYRSRIEDFYLYNNMIEKSYQALNEKMPAAREKSLNRINQYYRDCIGDLQIENKVYLKKIECKIEKDKASLQIIKDNSDKIIRCVIEHVKKTCVNALNSTAVSIEEIEMHAEYIVFHAFVECKVLEKPL